ncbi:hypothetical protein Patl1_27111 [Pistacia atlantica]|uniref:Uncharacterized protein n=1 Tax=Pistacia atlantica TaxID=434234 RepID=A0ACC1B4N4_9ROSI|nr:hypothetical protein Patl1_27111 [Pistacia atlantica]
MKLELLDDLQKAKGAGIRHICWSIISIFLLSVPVQVMLILILITKTSVVWYGSITVITLPIVPRLVRLLTLFAKAIPAPATFGLWLLKFFYSYVRWGQVSSVT